MRYNEYNKKTKPKEIKTMLERFLLKAGMRAIACPETIPVLLAATAVVAVVAVVSECADSGAKNK